MKLIIAFVRPFKLEEIRESLFEIGPAGFELIKCFATSRDISRDLPEYLLAGREDTTISPIEGDIHKNLSDIFTRYDPNVTEDSIPVTVIKKRFN